MEDGELTTDKDAPESQRGDRQTPEPGSCQLAIVQAQPSRVFWARFASLLFCLFIAGFVGLTSGCGPEPKEDSVDKEGIRELAQKQIKSQKEVLKILNTIVDKKSMEQAYQPLTQHFKKHKDTQSKFAAMSRKEKQALEEMTELADKLNTANEKQKKELKRIAETIPDGTVFVHNLRQLETYGVVEPPKSGEK